MTAQNRKPTDVSGISLYKGMCDVFREVTSVVLNVKKDVKNTTGYRLVNEFNDMLSLLVETYVVKGNGRKYGLAVGLYLKFKKVEVFSKLLRDTGYISKNQYARISASLGCVGRQVRSWMESLERKAADAENENTDLNI